MTDTSGLNREARRYAQRQGLLDESGDPVRQERDPSSFERQERTPPGQYFREVRKELQLVEWPSRGEVFNYSMVVLALLVIFTFFVAALDSVIGEAVVRLFTRT